MKTYNEIIVDRLRNMPGNRYQAPLDAADVIEQQDQEIALWNEDFQEAMEVSKIAVATMKIANDRILELEKTLRWIHDNPCAHPENVKRVVKDALGFK